MKKIYDVFMNFFSMLYQVVTNFLFNLYFRATCSWFRKASLRNQFDIIQKKYVDLFYQKDDLDPVKPDGNKKSKNKTKKNKIQSRRKFKCQRIFFSSFNNYFFYSF